MYEQIQHYYPLHVILILNDIRPNDIYLLDLLLIIYGNMLSC